MDKSTVYRRLRIALFVVYPIVVFLLVGSHLIPRDAMGGNPRKYATRISYVIGGISPVVMIANFLYPTYWQKWQAEAEGIPYVTMSIAPKTGLAFAKNIGIWGRMLNQIARHGDRPCPHISWEINAKKTKIVFVCKIPASIEAVFRQQLQVEWPECDIRRVKTNPDDVPFVRKEVVFVDPPLQPKVFAEKHGGEMSVLVQEFFESGDIMLPMLENMGGTSVPALISTIRGLPLDTWAGIQFMFRPVSRSVYTGMQQRVFQLDNQMNPQATVGADGKRRIPNKPRGLDRLRNQHTAISGRLKERGLYEVHIRFWMASSDAQWLQSSFQSYASSLAGVFGRGVNELVPAGQPHNQIEVVSERRWPPRAMGIMSAKEMGEVIALPNEKQLSQFKILHKAGAKNLHPHPLLRRRPNEPIQPGEMIYGYPVVDDSDDSADNQTKRKMYSTHEVIVGETGVGKSTMLVSTTEQLFRQKIGHILVDPNDDLANDALSAFDPREMDRVYIFDPDSSRPARMNMCDVGRDAELSIRTKNVAGAIRTAFPTNWDSSTNVRTLIESCITLALAYEEDADIILVERILKDESYRQHVIRALGMHPEAKSALEYFRINWEAFAESQRGVITNAASVRMSSITSSSATRRSIGMKGTTINMTRILLEGKTLIMPLHDKMGIEAKKIIVGTFMRQFFATMLARSNMPRDMRPLSVLTIDEFPPFVQASGEYMAMALAQARKFGGEIRLVCQFLNQIKQDKVLFDAVMSQCLSATVLRVSNAKQAKIALELLGDEVSYQDIQYLPAYHAYMKGYVKGKAKLPPTMVELLPPVDMRPMSWKPPTGPSRPGELPDPAWHGLTIWTSNALRSHNVQAMVQDRHPASHLKTIHKLERTGKNSDVMEYVLSIPSETFSGVVAEQKKIEMWQAKQIRDNPQIISDNVTRIKQYCAFRDGIKWWVSDRDFMLGEQIETPDDDEEFNDVDGDEDEWEFE